MMNVSRKRNEKGFSTAWVLGFALLIFLTGAVFFQFGSVLVERQKLVTAADRASNAGATAIDEDTLISSDGDTLKLDPSVSVQRCDDAINSESDGQAKNTLESSQSTCALDTSGKIITATVKGKVSLGILSSWLGLPTKEFTIVSAARPSCSDSTSASGDC